MEVWTRWFLPQTAHGSGGEAVFHGLTLGPRIPVEMFNASSRQAALAPCSNGVLISFMNTESPGHLLCRQLSPARNRHNPVWMQDNCCGRPTADVRQQDPSRAGLDKEPHFAACHRTRPAAFASGSVMLRMMDDCPPPFPAALLPCNPCAEI